MASKAGHWCASLTAQQDQAWGPRAHPHTLTKKGWDLHGKGQEVAPVGGYEEALAHRRSNEMQRRADLLLLCSIQDKWAGD